jgi:hypothetical protein
MKLTACLYLALWFRMHGAIPLLTHVLYWLAQRLYLYIGLKLLMVTKSDEIMLDVSHNNSEQTVVLVVTVMVMMAVMTIYKVKCFYFLVDAYQVHKALNLLGF